MSDHSQDYERWQVVTSRPLTREDGTINPVELQHRLDEIHYQSMLNNQDALNGISKLTSQMELGFKDLQSSIDVLAGEKKIQNGRVAQVEIALKLLQDWKSTIQTWFDTHAGFESGQKSILGRMDKAFLLALGLVAAIGTCFSIFAVVTR